MQDSGYIPASDPAPDLALIHIPPGATEPAWIPLPYMRAEVQALVDYYWEHRT